MYAHECIIIPIIHCNNITQESQHQKQLNLNLSLDLINMI